MNNLKIYHFDSDTFELIGESYADEDPLQIGSWLIPANATDIKPPKNVEGKTRHLIANSWEYKEIPIHKKAIEPAQPTEEEKRKTAILFELEKIDRESMRPARAIAVSMATETVPDNFDIRKLQSLEQQAAALRAELSSIK